MLLRRTLVGVVGLAVIAAAATTLAGNPTPFEPTSRCSSYMHLRVPRTLLVGAPQSIEYTADQRGTLPADAQLMIFGGDRKLLFPMAALSGQVSLPTDLAAGTYEVGVGLQGGLRWGTAAPRPTITVNPSRTVRFSVAMNFPCDLDPRPLVSTKIAVSNTIDTRDNRYPLKLIATTRNATTGITTVTYEGGGLAPLGALRVTALPPATPVTAWSGSGYAASQACKLHDRHSAQSVAAVAGMIDAPPAADPAITKGLLAVSFAPAVGAQGYGAAEVAPGPAPPAVPCIGEP